MNFETATKVSEYLVEEGVSHTIQVGVHPSLHPSVACRVDLQLRGIEGESLDRLVELRDGLRSIDPHGIAVHVSSFPNVGVYVS